MKKHLIITSLLALGLSMPQAQAQIPQPMQGGANPRGAQQQNVPSAAGQGSMSPDATQAAPQTFKGCVNGSPGSWTLISDKGKSMPLSGTDNQLSQYKGQAVRIHGVQGSDGTITVSSVDKVSDDKTSQACANQSSSNMGAQSSSTNQNDTNNQSSTSNTSTATQSATTTQPSSSTDTTNQSSTTPATSTTPDSSSAMTGQTSSATASNNAPGTTTPPVTNQTPESTVGSGTTGQSTAQTPATSNSDQNTASTTPSSDQSTNQNAASSTGTQNSDQGVRHYSDMNQNDTNQNTGQKLPQTASPLPLLGLLGFGSLVTGLVSRRKK
jgi:hypothetical protein